MIGRTRRQDGPGRKVPSGFDARALGLGGLARLRQIVLTAVIAGLAAGLLLTGLQRIAVVPIILEAETYEQAAAPHAHGHDAAAGAANATAHEQNQHQHDAAPPDPGQAAGDEASDEGGGRFWLTLIANLVGGAGFGLLLAAGMSLVAAIGRHIDWKKGLLWGLAGYGAFQLAPALGLPPEIPGAAVAELGARQGWWIMTVLLTGIGFAWAAFAPRPWMKALAAVPIVIPHLIGAPAPAHHGGLAPETLATQFIYAALITNFVFWLALGGLAGVVHSSFERRAAVAAG